MTSTFEIQNFKKIDRRKQKLLNCKPWCGQMKFLNNASYQSTVGSPLKCIFMVYFWLLWSESNIFQSISESLKQNYDFDYCTVRCRKSVMVVFLNVFLWTFLIDLVLHHVTNYIRNKCIWNGIMFSVKRQFKVNDILSSNCKSSFQELRL